MFNLSGSEIVVILLLALVVLGPEKLPDAVRRFGRTYGELKRMSSSFQEEMRSTIEEPMREVRETADLIREQVDFAAAADDKPKSGNPMDDAPALESAPGDADDDVVDDDVADDVADDDTVTDDTVTERGPESGGGPTTA